MQLITGSRELKEASLSLMSVHQTLNAFSRVGIWGKIEKWEKWLRWSVCVWDNYLEEVAGKEVDRGDADENGRVREAVPVKGDANECTADRHEERLLSPQKGGGRKK